MLTNQKQLHEMAAILGGVPVLATIPDSPSAKAGITYGDIILSVNGKRVTNISEWVSARKTVQNKLDLVLWRNGQELTFQLEFPSDNG